MVAICSRRLRHCPRRQWRVKQVRRVRGTHSGIEIGAVITIAVVAAVQAAAVGIVTEIGIGLVAGMDRIAARVRGAVRNSRGVMRRRRASMTAVMSLPRRLPAT